MVASKSPIFQSVSYRNGLLYQEDFTSHPFEKAYIELRTCESRVYADHLLKNLPDIPSGHPLEKEWSIRKSSLTKLISYLRKTSAKRILELGCGNGWLSHRLATSLVSEVFAMDINETELLQGARVFEGVKNLIFICGDIRTSKITPQSFDCIVLAASIQYFPDFGLLIKRLLSLLTPTGEIHIIDTPFYHDDKLATAKQRSKTYFENSGFAAMAPYYNHHTWSGLKSFNYKVMYEPGLVHHRIRSIFFPMSPFPWIKIVA